MPGSRLKSFLSAMMPVVVVTAAGISLYDALSVSGCLLLYLLAIVWVAFTRGPVVSTLAVVAAAIAFNFFFLPPRFTFRIADEPSWLAFIGLLVVSLSVNHLAQRLRGQTVRAETRAREAQQARHLAEQLGAMSDPREIAQSAVNALHDASGQAAALYVRGDQDVQLLACLPADAQDSFDANAARWVLAQARPIGPGSPDWPELGYRGLPLPGAAGPVGVVLLRDGGPAGTGREDADARGHLETLARQAALALQRAHADAAEQGARRRADTETARNALLASVSHDLRTPLAVLVGAASTLLEQDGALAAAERKRLLQSIVDESRRMSRTADNALALARLIGSTAPLLRRDWESAEELVGSVVAPLRERFPGLDLQVDVPPQLPLLQVDGGLVGQCLGNLLENAAIHGQPADGSPVRIGLQVESAGNSLVFRIRDHGPGLPKGVPAEQLFGSFVRGARKPGTGHGLGLAIAQLVARLHGGTLAAANAADGGAEFRLVLPASPAPAIPESPA